MARQTNTKIMRIRKCSMLDTIIALALVCFGAISFITLGPYIDKLFPVVEPLVVTESKIQGDTLITSGWLYKRRDCERIAVVAQIHFDNRPSAVENITFFDNTMLVSRPEGTHIWGPWAINIPKNTKRVTLYSSHNCHPFWTTKTRLGVIYER